LVCGRRCIDTPYRFVTHAEIKVLADLNGWGEQKRAAPANALSELVTVNIDSETLIDAYVRVEAACYSDPNGARVMGKNDIWIAATALVSQLPLITTDKDFDHLNGRLITVCWIDPTLGKAESQ
jgi:tRNA(fMet)-specific endonuclease VapC